MLQKQVPLEEGLLGALGIGFEPGCHQSPCVGIHHLLQRWPRRVLSFEQVFVVVVKSLIAEFILVFAAVVAHYEIDAVDSSFVLSFSLQLHQIIHF